MVNALEFLYLVTAVSAVVAMGLALAGREDTDEGRARRRRARVFATVAVVTGTFAAGLYWTLN
jgi:hypothetical protein